MLKLLARIAIGGAKTMIAGTAFVAGIAIDHASGAKQHRVEKRDSKIAQAFFEGTLICCECKKVIVAPDDIQTLSATADNDRVVCSSCYQMYTCGGG